MFHSVSRLFNFLTWPPTSARCVERRRPFLFTAMAAVPPSVQSQAVQSGDLIDLVSSSTATTVYPSDDTILSVLQARFRQDLPYSRIGASNFVVVNPYKSLASVNDVSAKEYEERSYKDTNLPMVDSPRPLQPHPYDTAARMYLLMRRRNESQSIMSRYISSSSFSVHSLTFGLP